MTRESRFPINDEILDSVSAHIAVINSKGIIVSVNKAWSDFGKANSRSSRTFPARTNVGTDYLKVLLTSKGENSKEAILAYRGIRKVLTGELKKFSLEYRCDSKKERRWFKMVALPLRKKMKGAVITHHDITQSKLLEEQQQQYSAELKKTVREKTKKLQLALSKEKELAQLKEKFISNTSHEFRTPLTTVAITTGFIKKYKNKIDDNQIDDKLDLIQKQVHHLSLILDDLFLLGNQQTKERANFVRVPLQSLINEIVAEANEVDKSRRIDVQFDCMRDWICTDKMLIRNILINLISNAIKFSSAEANVKVTISCDDKSYLFTIRDFGKGIPDKEQANLFQPFYRGKNSDNIPGNGVGLSIAKKSVNLLGGNISFVSESAKGTTFKVTIPKIDLLENKL